jgi:hypothetical protein
MPKGQPKQADKRSLRRYEETVEGNGAVVFDARPGVWFALSNQGPGYLWFARGEEDYDPRGKQFVEPRETRRFSERRIVRSTGRSRVQVEEYQ